MGLPSPPYARRLQLGNRAGRAVAAQGERAGRGSVFARVVLATVALLTAAGAVAAAPLPPHRAYFRLQGGALPTVAGTRLVHRLPGGLVSIEGPPEAIEALRQDPNLAFVDSVRIYWMTEADGAFPLSVSTVAQDACAPIARTCLLSDYGLPQVSWSVADMYGNPTLLHPSGGAGVKVGIVDTGVALHPDLVNRVRYCMDHTKTPADSCCGDDESAGHGTAIASVVGADGGADGLGMYGIAPEVLIYSARVCSNYGGYEGCPDDDVAAGIYDLVDRGVDIINMSFGGKSMSSTVQAAIDYAVARNVVLVAAAGNSGPDSGTIQYPAAYVKVVSVGAINQAMVTAPFSSRGINDGDYVRDEREIDVAAPGVFVLAVNPNGCYGYYTGTSLAAPHVAGLAARIWDGSATSVRARLQDSARRHDLDAPGDDPATGFGLPTLVMTLSVGGNPSDHAVSAIGRPNPFRTSVSLPFVTSVDAEVRVEVLDSAGRLVRRLQPGTLTPGAHVARWDGDDEAGRSASPGLYFLRVRWGDRSVTSRVVRLQ